MALLVLVFEIYVAAGVLFAGPFLFLGAAKVDPITAQSTWGFRLVVTPGIVALWPLLGWRWLRGTAVPVERNPHRERAG